MDTDRATDGQGVEPPAEGSANCTAAVTPDFDAFYRVHHDRVYRALGLALRNLELARDATDEAMARALEQWRKIGRYDRPEQWVFRVGLNWAISQMRRYGRASAGVLVEPRAAQQFPDPDVAAALAKLPVKLRAVVVARLYLDWSTNSTSAALGIPAGTVKSRLSRALRYLERELERGT